MVFLDTFGVVSVGFGVLAMDVGVGIARWGVCLLDDSFCERCL